jgi:hypothetical protein
MVEYAWSFNGLSISTTENTYNYIDNHDGRCEWTTEDDMASLDAQYSEPTSPYHVLTDDMPPPEACGEPAKVAMDEERYGETIHLCTLHAIKDIGLLQKQMYGERILEITGNLSINKVETAQPA